MSLLNRRSGRRVAGVIVGASLLVLGLEAPAFAAPPTIASFTPASGPDDCVITVTGTEFDNTTSPIVDVSIGGASTAFSVQSNTEIWVAANGLTGFIEVENSLAEVATSAPTAFQDTDGTDLGGCAPTITSFTPTCGTVGTPVSIDGANLFESAGDDTTTPPTAPVSGFVEFSPFDAGGVGVEAAHTGAPESPTHLVVTVPAGAATGRIRVTTLVDAVLTAADFTVVTDPALCPDVEPEPGDRHERNVRLRLRAHLIGKGKVTVPDGTTECAQNVPVKIQRKRSGGWRTVKATTTSVTGSFKKRLPDRPGVYRAVARKITLPDTGDICVKDVSNRVRHRH